MTLQELIKGTCEVIGQPTTDIQLAMLVTELEAYPREAVKAALARCRRELRGKLALSDVLDRIPGGRPGVEEAWALVAKSLQNEAVSIVWTDEMREAYGVACAVGDDKIAARMAFKEKYAALVADARASYVPVRWSASLGWDPQGRIEATFEAENRNRIAQGMPALPATALLEDRQEPTKDVLALIASVRK